MKNQVTVTVSGVTGSGKSRILFFIKDMLAREGFDVEYIRDKDHANEKTFDLVMKYKLTDALQSLKDNKTVVIFKEIQTQRPIREPKKS